MGCINCGHEHDPSNLLFCKERYCTCSHYISDGMQIIAKIQKAIEGFKTTKETVEFMLRDVPEFRDLNNKDFVFLFWHYTVGYVVPPRIRNKLVDPESIRRMKQKLVEENPELAPHEEITMEKLYKKWGIEEYLTE